MLNALIAGKLIVLFVEQSIDANRAVGSFEYRTIASMWLSVTANGVRLERQPVSPKSTVPARSVVIVPNGSMAPVDVVTYMPVNCTVVATLRPEPVSNDDE